MKRMLIDAAHTEETRVVILDGNKIDDFEIETQGKAQLKGNIYIGHVSRVEPSLQAAFITYGGNRNGFLAFGEVHPQFFAVSKTEKAELLKEVAEAAARRRGADFDDEPEQAEEFADTLAHEDSAQSSQKIAKAEKAEKGNEATEATSEELSDEEAAAKAAALADSGETGKESGKEGRGRRGRQPRRMESKGRPRRAEASSPVAVEEAASSEAEAKGSKEKPKNQPPIHRRYRIQDVLKEGQKILVQVVKEERGSKGAALTTYFSLPGRYTVLMPNTPYAGGISRKITDPQERRQLREAYSELNVPATMGLIIRTAGVGQPMEHITNDYENLTNLWKHINEQFDENEDIQCVHEDGSVIIRALRDMTNEDIGEITISGARAYKMAKDFAKSFMPDTIGLIKQYKDETPLFSQAKVEQKLNMLHHTRVTLPSGGYLVINPTEALVSVDINSGRATQERNIEETAVKTNLEACEELARQIRLRDLAGLIVVDFIDMEDNRNNRKVENAMRKALRRDRARIQTGNISDFGLMEISRQRLRPSFGESHFIACPHCLGSGQVHSPATAALMVLRKLEEDDVRDADRITVTSSTPLVLWLLNHKRDVIRSLEERYKYQLQFRADDRLTAPDHTIELISFKSDGTEHSRLIEVTLREQPELPPELRQRHQGGGQRREERREERRDEPRREQRTERSEKQEKSDKPERNERHDKNDKARKPERNDRNDKHTKSDKPERSDKEQSGGARRPRRLGEADTQTEETVTEASEGKSDKRVGKPQREAKSDNKADTKPEPKAEKKTEQKHDKPKPVREQKPAEDQPLAVQKVSVEKDDTPVIQTAPRKKFEIRKQADTDAADAPIAIAKLSEESQPEPTISSASRKKESKEKAGIISRLIGR